jgi:hypothetical protein
MCVEKNNRLAVFLKERFHAAAIEEILLSEEERAPLTICAIMTDTGSLFAGSVSNAASSSNVDGSNPLQEALQNLENHENMIRSEFKIAGIAFTTSVDPESTQLIPVSWDIYTDALPTDRKEKVEQANLNKLLHVCPVTDQQMMLEI